jgi:ribosomal-protein-alanine N-acetyltransferase
VGREPLALPALVLTRWLVSPFVGDAEIDFVRLTEVPLTDVLDLLNEPRNARHMPLSGTATPESAAEWVAAKDSQWELNGYGPWAVLLNGAFAGWGGFQREPNGTDFALVLLPAHWGRGAAVTRAALDRGFGELGLDEVTIALPYTRSPDRVVARLGFVSDGTVTYHEVSFRQYRLSRSAWMAATLGVDSAGGP